jgi:hypothetical protein
MQPQQPQQPQVNYDFIMNPEQQHKHSPLGGGSSMGMRIAVVLGGVLLLVIIVAIAMSLFKGGGVDEKTFVEIAQEQTEIIRLSDNGIDNSVSQTTKNFAVTAKVSMASEQRVLLEGVGLKIPEKQLALKANSKIDAQLTDAKSASNYDATYTSVMKAQLEAYMADLSAAYPKSGPKTKELLSARYDTAELLLTQLTGEVKQ